MEASIIFLGSDRQGSDLWYGREGLQAELGMLWQRT